MRSSGTVQVIASAVVLVCFLAVNEQAGAATGDLAGRTCISGDLAAGTSGTGLCTQSPGASTGGVASGLDGIQSVDISGDGTDVYAAAQSDDAIVQLRRNPSTGGITFAECITGGTAAGPTGSGACDASPTAVTGASNSGFDDLIETIVSPDGSSVYAISQNDDAVVHFERNSGTGALTFAECWSGEEATTTTGGGPCEDVPPEAPSGTNSGIDSPSGIAISADGESVYVTSANDDAIVRFDRNTSDGALEWGDCITAEAASGPTGTAACSAAPTITASGAGTGLDVTFTPVVSPDDETVYVGSNDDASVFWFDRNTTSGVLTADDCVTGDADIGPDGTSVCQSAVPAANSVPSATNSGMNRIQAIAVSPDGDSVYAGAQVDATVNHFTRSAGGSLTFEECLTGNQGIATAGCTAIPTATANGHESGLEGTQSLAISPDGKSLYAAAAGDDAVATFDRSRANGNLEWDRCATGETESGPAGSDACVAPGATAGGAGSGLDLVRSLAVSSDGLQLIAGTESDDSIVAAARSNAPETSIESSPPAITADPTPSFGFSADEAPVIFGCRVDGVPFSACSGTGTHTTAALADGMHTFEVRAVNNAASADPTPASRTFVVDTVPPDTEITAGPSGSVADGDVQFSFGPVAGGVALECSLDGAAFTTCTSPSAFQLADGQHTFEVRSTDLAGNVDPSPAQRSFAVDTVKPDTLIDKQPKKTERTNKKKKTFKFRFHSDEAGTEFECKADSGKEWKACESPFSRKYKKGKHVFKVRSIDAAGNVDGSAASRTWKVKRKS